MKSSTYLRWITAWWITAAAILASPALAQQPNGTINAPIYATGYISQVGGTNVTTTIKSQPNHPTNLNIYTTGTISGTWTIKLPNPAFEGQMLSFNCGAAANVISVTSSDGSTIDSTLPTACSINSGFTIQFDQRSNIWRNIGSNNTSTFKPFTGVASQWPWQLNADGTWTLKQPASSDIKFTQTGTGAVATTIDAWVKQRPITPQDFGTIGGVDDTTAIDRAFAAAASQKKCVYFPAQSTVYAYNGSGQDYDNICMFGDGINLSIVTINTGKYLVDANRAMTQLRIEGLQFNGGAGVYRNRYTGTSVALEKIVARNSFYAQTGAVISSNSSDDPFWKITGNHFNIDKGTGVGIALAGLADGDEIAGNNFDEYKIGIKLGLSGQNGHLKNNAFAHFNAGTARSDIWIVPNASAVNAGHGFIAEGTRHGNENLDATDYAILYADEGAGTYFGDRLPVYTDSTGYIIGHTIRDSMIGGVGDSGTRPLVYSTTPNVIGSSYQSVVVNGTPPTYIVQIKTPPATDTPFNRGNVIGPVSIPNQALGSFTGFKYSNALSMFTYVDPQNVNLYADQNAPLQLSGSADTGTFTDLSPGVMSGWTDGGLASSVGATDATDGSDARTITFSSSAAFSGTFYGVLSGPATVGVPMYIEFDVLAGSLTNYTLQIQESTGFVVVHTMYMSAPSARRRVRFLWTPRSAGGTLNFIMIFSNGSGGSGTLTVGRFRAYQALSPASGNVFLGTQYMKNTVSAPSNNPSGGGYLYVEGGALKYRGSGGTVTTVASP